MLEQPLLQRETIIQYNEGEDEALVWTTSRITQRKVEHLGIGPYRVDPLPGVVIQEARYYRVPKSCFYFRKAYKSKVYTPEEIQVMRDRGTALWRTRFGGQQNAEESADSK